MHLGSFTLSGAQALLVMPIPRPQPVFVNGKNRAADALRQAVDASMLLNPGEEKAAIHVEVQDGRFVFVLEDRALGAVRFAGFRPDRKARETLEHLAGYLNIREIANRYTRLGDALEVKLLRLVEAGTRARPGRGEAINVVEGAAVIAHGRNLAIEVTNRAEVPLYIYVLDLDQEIRLAPLYPPSGYGKPIKPGETLPIGFGPDAVITLSVPKGQNTTEDHLVILGSVGAIDPEALILPALGEKYTPIGDLFGTGSRLDRDLRTALTGQVPEAATALDPKDDWTAVHRTVAVHREP